MVKFLQLLFRDKWANRAMIVLTVCLIVLLFAARESFVERTALWAASAVMAGFVARGIYLALCLRCGRPIARESRHAVERRKRLDDWFSALWFGLALAIAIWKWIAGLRI